MSEFDDARLERDIKVALANCERAHSEGRSAEAQEHWNEFVKLIGQRSPKQVAKMEKSMGLDNA